MSSSPDLIGVRLDSLYYRINILMNFVLYIYISYKNWHVLFDTHNFPEFEYITDLAPGLINMSCKKIKSD